MKNNMIFLLVILMVIFSCAKKTEDEPSGWTQEDQAFLENIRLLQNEAAEHYNEWSLTMDSLDMILQLQLRIPGPPMKAVLLQNSGRRPSELIPIMPATGNCCTTMTLCTVMFQHG